MVNDLGDLVDGKFIPSFDPFAHGFSFAVGFEDPIDPKIGTLELKYIEDDDKKEKTVKKSLPLKKCSEL
jgi:hypothetical protein